MHDEQDRLIALRERGAPRERSNAASPVRVAKAVLDDYASSRRERGWLDFADLIALRALRW